MKLYVNCAFEKGKFSNLKTLSNVHFAYSIDILKNIFKIKYIPKDWILNTELKMTEWKTV